MICGCPAPGAAAKAALDDTFAVDLADHLAIASKESPRRADLGTKRQLALGNSVGAIKAELLRRAVPFRPARAIGTFVHDAARSELGCARVLGRPERAGIKAVAAAYAGLLIVEDHADIGLVDAICRADRDTGRICAVHATGGDGFLLARHPVIDGDDATPQHAPGDFVLVLADTGAGHAFDAALGVTEEFHPCHLLLLTPSRCGRW